MPNPIRDLRKVDTTTFDYIYDENVTVPLKDDKGLVRCNVYRPKDTSQKYPVLVTYGPYGKDIHYSHFHGDSFSEIPAEHRSPHSAWETPDPGFWTRHSYAVVRADELGCGQSPGMLDTMSKNTSEAFFDVVEWAATQPWSSGKVGLLGISYYAGSQWRVAARRPRGLACIVPWEGMSDYYRDRCRHGGILSNTFIEFWWNRQVVTNQYGRPGRADRNWGPDTIEGDLSEGELVANRRDQTVDNATYRFHDEEYYASREYRVEDIEVPVLSVGNWGGILLHLRGNIHGFLNAGSKLKYLRLITGRHDLPFYSEENVAMQKSFLDAFLKGEDVDGWTTGGAPRVSLVLRRGDVGFNDAEAEKEYVQRDESDWPIPRTQYVKFLLTAGRGLTLDGVKSGGAATTLSYKALGTIKAPEIVQFVTEPFEQETEFTGHIVAHLNVSVSPAPGSQTVPSDIDLFLTIRHLDAQGREIYYTGTVGDPVPVTKGWLRVSLRKTETSGAKPWHPHREYRSSDVQPVQVGQIYGVDAEVWPTNVVVSPGNRLVLEVSSGDTQGAGLFEHTSEVDRPSAVFEGVNHVHFGGGHDNWLMMPLIPSGI